MSSEICIFCHESMATDALPDNTGPIRHVVSVSGGKDSTALYLLAMERLGGDFDAVFADTGNEHEATYEYVARLHERTGGPKVQVIKADFSAMLARKKAFLDSGKASARSVNPWTEERVAAVLAAGLEPTGTPFLDLCRAKGFFPAQNRAFCSQNLKRIPLFTLGHQPLIDAGFAVVSWQGIRAAESPRRAKSPFVELSPESERMVIFRPIMPWSVADVAAQHRRHGLRLNPLYGRGFSRVGCMPCINSNKSDIQLTARFFPEHLEKIRQWELAVRAVSRCGKSTFFHRNTLSHCGCHEISDVVRWSLTWRGGKQFSLMQYMPPAVSDVCVYAGWLCE